MLYPPKNAYLVAKDGSGEVIPLYCYVTWKGKSYHIIAYARDNQVVGSPLSGSKTRVYLPADEVQMEESSQRKKRARQADPTEYSNYELNRARRSEP